MLLLVRRFKHLEFMSDRFRRYFLYALGEMVLVVVGILIALQIDNWNSNRQDDARLQSHLQSIARNVGEDLAELQALKSFRQEAVVDGWRVLDYLTAQSTFSTKDISLYSKARFEASAQEIFAANTSGYDSLKNSDVLGRLQGNDIENLLADYYDVVGRIENLEASHNSYVRSLEVPFILEYPPEAESYAFITPDSLPGERFEELQPVYHRRINSALSHALIGSTSNLSVLLRYYQRLETLGRTYVRLVNRGTMNLNAEDAAILAGMRDWVTGFADPALVAKGSPNLGSYYIGRESALGAAVFDIHSLALTDEGVRLGYNGGAAWATFWFGPHALQESRVKLDYSAFDRLILEIKSDGGGEQIAVIMKDVHDPDDEAPPSIEITLSSEWQTYEIDLADFVTPDLTVLHVPLGFLFAEDPVSFTVRDARFVKSE
jgi:hypothetical protein